MTPDEIVRALRDYFDGKELKRGTVLNAADLIESLQAENARLKQNPKCGEWIKVDQVYVKCFFCEKHYFNSAREYIFCPNCGARMGGEHDN